MDSETKQAFQDVTTELKGINIALTTITVKCPLHQSETAKHSKTLYDNGSGLVGRLSATEKELDDLDGLPSRVTITEKDIKTIGLGAKILWGFFGALLLAVIASFAVEHFSTTHGHEGAAKVETKTK